VAWLVATKRESDEAAARVQFLTDHMHDLDDATRSLESAQLDLAVAQGRLTEEQGKAVSAQDAMTRSIDDFRKAQEKERAAAADAVKAGEGRLLQLQMLPGPLADAIDYTMGYSSAVEEGINKVRELDRIEGEYQTLVIETTKATEGARKATEARAASVKTTSSAVKDAAAVEKDAAASLREIIAQQDKMSAQQRKLDEEDDKARQDAAEKLLATMGETLSARAEMVNLAQDEAAADRAAAAAVAAGKMDTVGKSVTGGPQAGIAALGNSGPVGGIIAAIINVVANLQEWMDNAAAYHKQVMEGLGNLGPVLGDNVGKHVKEGTAIAIKGVGDLVAGLVGNIIPIIGGIVSGLVDGIIQGFGDLIKEFVNMLLGKGQRQAGAAVNPDGHISQIYEGSYWENVGYDVRDWFDFANKYNDKRYEDAPAYATGSDYVGRTGMAIVHQGERIVPANGAGSGRTSSMMGSGGGTSVNVASVFPPSARQTAEIVREINRQMGTRGARLSWGS